MRGFFYLKLTGLTSSVCEAVRILGRQSSLWLRFFQPERRKTISQEKQGEKGEIERLLP
jgi:hypothetical protein